MGAIAFCLLMVAELAVSVLLFGRSLTGFVAGLRTAPGAIRLAAQAAFGLIPLVRLCAAARTGAQIRDQARVL
jgi:hypothetical protein